MMSMTSLMHPVECLNRLLTNKLHLFAYFTNEYQMHK